MPVFVGILLLVGGPPSGRFLVVCEDFRDEGVAPTRECPYKRMPVFVGILLLVGAPPSGRWVVVCEAYRDGGVAPTNNTQSRFDGRQAP